MTGPAVTRRRLLLGVLGLGIAGGGVVSLQALGEESSPATTPAGSGRLLIGSVLPMSGQLAADGRELRDGAALAIAQLNAAGGVRGRQLRHVVSAADVTSADAVAAAVRELAAARVAAFVNGYVIDWSTALPAAAAYGVPYLHASSSDEQRLAVAAAGDRYRMVFQTTPTERLYGSGLVPLLDRLGGAGLAGGARRIAVLQRTIPHTQAIEDGLRAAAAGSSGGYEVLPRQDLVRPVTDWTPVLAALQADVVVVNTPDPVEAADFVRAFLARPSRSLLYLAGSADGGFRATVGVPTDGLLWSRLSSRQPGAAGDRFAADFRTAYGRDPGPTLASATYDAVHVLASAWETGGRPDDAAATADALRAGVVTGVNGGYSFATPGQTVPSFPTGDPDLRRSQPQQFLQDRDGGAVVVDPAPLSTAGWQQPAWFA